MLNALRLLAALALLSATPAFAADFVAGKHYTVIAEDAADAPVVMEFFSYGCPHCYTFQPFMNQLKAAIGEKAETLYVPVDFGGGYWTATQELFLVLEALGRLDELHMKAFEYIHNERNTINSSRSAQRFLEQYGVSAEEYSKAAKSFAAHVRKKRYDQLTQRHRIAGTPTIIVNEKYRVELGELNGGPAQFVELVEFLLQNP